MYAANEAFEKVASYGLMPNMILYLMRDYGLEMTTGTNILYMWSAATSFMPLIGVVLSDSYFGRFQMIGFGSIASLLGMILIWLTAMIPQARPPPCDQSAQSCQSPTFSQLSLLCSSFLLMSIGSGGIRSSSAAFGLDQLYKGNINLGTKRTLESFFCWYYTAATVSALIALTCIVYIQDHLGWKVGFGVPAIFMFLSTLSFFWASPWYVKLEANRSLFVGLAQVVVAAHRNRHVELNSSKNTDLKLYYNNVESNLKAPTEKLRFFNKACIITSPEKNYNPWSICTVDQVEELKAIIKVIPLWSTGILMSVSMNQGSFPLLQANSMDRCITSKFEIPAGSFGVFTVVAIVIWLPLYDRIILPLASKIMGKPVCLSARKRMGIGLLLSCMSMAVSAIVESHRRRTAVLKGFSDDPKVSVSMSAMWLVPQHCLGGFADCFNAVGQSEFYISEFPESMTGIASNLCGFGMSIANLLASFILSTVNNITRRGGRESWVSTDINKGHFDYYYWLLAALGLVNFVYFLVCCKAYGPRGGERFNVRHEEEDMTGQYSPIHV
ncbi:protein NRT1/ PTR FAMILY 1.2-like [Malania oleifera]|uniref:protein NRT1/ PTR FAMILY 1.2-like n=1 Tax=Malania oleifera TaxID=397392 RepID=UPI0025AE0AB7|nr:protein NRT1/ PTR FAMILY 1.2-like [Malania oleifera]